MTRANTKIRKNTKGPVEEGIIDEMVSTLGSSLDPVFQQAIGNTNINKQLLNNPLALRGGWNHPLAWANTSPAVQASPLAPLLLGGEVQLGFPEDPFRDEIHNLQDHPPVSTQDEQTEIKDMAKLYKEETVQQAIVKYLDRCELKGVTDRFELMLQNIDSRMRDLPPMWVIEMGELILQGAARRWQGLMAAAIRASTVEVRRRIIEEKNRLKSKYPHSYRRICHDAYTRAKLAAKKIDKLQPPRSKFYLLQEGTPLIQYMNERTNMEMTGEERDMVLKCMRDIGINSHPEEPEPLEDEQKETENENTEPDQLNREQENEKEQKEQDKESEHNQTETEQENVIEQNIEACFPPPPPSNETEETPQAEKEASEERDNHIDLPPRGEDSTQISLPMNNTIRSPGTLELFLPTPPSPPCPSGLIEREEACNKLLEKVVGAIGQLEKVIANLNDKIIEKDTNKTEHKEQINQETEQNIENEEAPQIQKKKKNPETWMSLKSYAKRKTEEERRKNKKQPKNGQKQKKTKNAIQQNTKGAQTGGTTAQKQKEQRFARQHPPTRVPTHKMRKTHLTPYPKEQRKPQVSHQRRWQPHYPNHPQNWREAPQEQEKIQNKVRYHKNYQQQRFHGQNPHWISHPQPWRPPPRHGRFPQRGNYQWAQGPAGGRQWQEGGYGRWGWN